MSHFKSQEISNNIGKTSGQCFNVENLCRFLHTHAHTQTHINLISAHICSSNKLPRGDQIREICSRSAPQDADTHIDTARRRPCTHTTRGGSINNIAC